MSQRATVFLNANPDGVDEVLGLLRAYAEAGPNEPGNLFLRVSQDILDPSRFVMCEEWETQETLDEHMRQDHTRAVLAAFGNPELITGTEIWQSFEVESSGEAA